MIEKPFLEVYEVDLEIFYLHILIIVFQCGFKDLYGIHWLRKKRVIHFK